VVPLFVSGIFLTKFYVNGILIAGYGGMKSSKEYRALRRLLLGVCKVVESKAKAVSVKDAARRFRLRILSRKR
jgi:hypothetical protein